MIDTPATDPIAGFLGRQVILDTETTALEPQLGHRIIEIGCIELVNRRRTGRRLDWFWR